jgi:hypothetical protein
MLGEKAAKSNRMNADTKRQFARQGGCTTLPKPKKTAKVSPLAGRLMGGGLFLGATSGAGGARGFCVRAAFHATGRGGRFGSAAFLGGATRHEGGSANDQGEEFD